MKVAIPLAKKVLAPLGIKAAASAIDARIQKKMHGSGTTTLIISNEKINYIMKIVQSLEDSNILLKEVTKTIKNKAKEQIGVFLSMLLGTLGASLLGDLLAEIVRAGTGKQWDFLMPPHPLTNLKYKGIMKMNQDLMVLFQEIICLKQ